jgi:dTDP-4-dehydrorhamnose 3,5-epimerase
MRFVPTAIEGAWFVETDMSSDIRGSFTRSWCRDAFREAGIAFDPVQCSLSANPARGTLRGLHYQRPPHLEPKLILCVAGSMFDVAVDLRRSSPSFGKSVGTTLAAGAPRLFYIPAGCAHGFLTLAPETSAFYFIGGAFAADAGAGVRWNDRAFAIDWPEAPALMSDRDANYPDFDPDRDAVG